MKMKRRGFLQAFGAAFAAPLMPQMGFAATSPQMAAALAHAKARVSVSAWGLSQSLGVTMAQADTLMSDMATRGAIAQIQGGNGRWAVSRVYAPPLTVQAKTSRQTKPKPDAKSRTEVETRQNALMAHLHQMCRDSGYIVRVAA